MGEMLALAVETTDPSMPWLGPLIAVGSLLLGSGGLVAWRRLTHDKRIGVAQQETVEDDALSNRWKAIIETQTKVLLEPMQAQIATLTTEVAEVKVELAESRRKYWGAVGYIRTLHNWINRHLPESVEQVPPPPAILAEDI
ncbi:membrane protein [Microbacterium phage Hermeonysus]|nr:membrane protein [Microbacterium phage Hermeonysus]